MPQYRTDRSAPSWYSPDRTQLEGLLCPAQPPTDCTPSAVVFLKSVCFDGDKSMLEMPRIVDFVGCAVMTVMPSPLPWWIAEPVCLAQPEAVQGTTTHHKGPALLRARGGAGSMSGAPDR